MSKIERDAFLFLGPKLASQNEDFAQCGPCRMFVPEAELSGKLVGSRCIIHGSFVEIDEDDSCGFMVPWPTKDGRPNGEVVRDHAAELMKMIPGSVTGDASGLVSRRVQCHRCRFADQKAEQCRLYDMLSREMPSVFDLDPRISEHSCCNAQMPKASEEDYSRMGYAEKVAYAASSGVKTS